MTVCEYNKLIYCYFIQNKALLKAVGVGDTLVIEGLINRGADVNYYDYSVSGYHVIQFIIIW